MDRKSAGDAVTFRIFSRVAGRRNLTTQEQIKIFNISSEDFYIFLWGKKAPGEETMKRIDYFLDILKILLPIPECFF